MIFHGAQPSDEEVAAIAAALATLEPAATEAVDSTPGWALAGRDYGSSFDYAPDGATLRMTKAGRYAQDDNCFKRF